MARRRLPEIAGVPLRMDRNRSASIRAYGAQGRDRTTDTAIFSRMLYQLSYLGPRCAAGPRRGKRRVWIAARALP